MRQENLYLRTNDQSMPSYSCDKNEREGHCRTSDCSRPRLASLAAAADRTLAGQGGR